jgi:hypothetical protein
MKTITCHAVAAALALCHAGAARAQTGATTTTAEPQQQDPGDDIPLTNRQRRAALNLAAESADTAAKAKAADDFSGLGLAPGISLTADLGHTDRVAKAEIVNGIVRVTDQNNMPARLMLEGHYFFVPPGKGPFQIGEDMWGFGPFIALQPGDGKIIQAVAAGVMVGFRHDPKESSSFNLGVGVIIDPDVQVLGDGFVANKAPPEGETEIRYRETSQVGLLFMTSFSF